MIKYAGAKVFISSGRALLMNYDNTVEKRKFENATDAAHWIEENTNLVYAYGIYEETENDSVWVYGKRGAE